MCCSSREESRNFKQYIDSGSGEPQEEFYIPTLEEHWNSEHMKDVRRRMMDGEVLPECDVCNSKLLNTEVYRDYFRHLFENRREELIAATDDDGTLHAPVISFDYRYSNLCNFKCRMCGPMLSSTWETELRQVPGMNLEEQMPWLPYRDKLAENQKLMQADVYEAIEKGVISEIYWVGGEPLMFEEHWNIMQRIIDADLTANVYARYNTNLSRVNYKKQNLWDMLEKFPRWQICASIDGTGEIGEYIRTGLKWDTFLQNWKDGKACSNFPYQMRLDFTLTTPGLFEILPMARLATEHGTEILAKVCFEFSADLAMCPLWLPRDVLTEILEPIIAELKKKHSEQGPLIDVLENLLRRQVMEEKYDNYEWGRKKGKAWTLELEERRGGPTTMRGIFEKHSQSALEFWDSIDVD